MIKEDFRMWVAVLKGGMLNETSTISLTLSINLQEIISKEMIQKIATGNEVKVLKMIMCSVC